MSASSRAAHQLPPMASSLHATRTGVEPVECLVERALGDRYHVVRQLGSGASAVVYLARERSLHRTVVLKVLRPELAADPRACDRFRREARTTGQLSHPGIVPVHSYGVAELPAGRAGARASALHYMVLAYVGAESLADRLARTPRLPAAEVRWLLAELAGALEHAHREGVVHRDVKPENVLLGADATGGPARPVLIDFGVAAYPTRDAGPVPAAGGAGTPAFMAPEQVLGDLDVDGRSDVYALGVIGYLALAGRLPARVYPARTPLAALAPGAPADLVAAVERCLALEPSERWPRADALRAALLSGAHRRAPLRGALRELATRLRARLGAASARTTAAVRRALGHGALPRALESLR